MNNGRIGFVWKQAALLSVGLMLVAGQAMAATVTWTGAANSNWSDTNNWSGLALPAGGDDVLVTNAGYNVLLTSSTPDLASFVISNKTLIFSNWTACLSATNVTVGAGGTVTVANAFITGQMSNRVNIVCSNFTLDAGGIVKVVSNGFSMTYGPGAGVSIGDNGGGGGGHGGWGGFANSQVSGGVSYDMVATPELAGSGGGSSYLGSGAQGGGVVRIDAGGTATINGTINANGNAGGGWAGGGAGGAIWISCTNFAGTGALTADGGNGGAGKGGNGGGGRIAVSYAVWMPGTTVRISAAQGAGYSDFSIGRFSFRAWPGTVCLSGPELLTSGLSGFNGCLAAAGVSNWAIADLALTNSCFGLANGLTLFVSNNLAVTGSSAAVYIGEFGTISSNYPRLICGGNLVLTNGAFLATAAGVTNAALLTVTGAVNIASSSWMYVCSNPSNGGYAILKMGSLSIASNAGINANNSGYRQGYGPGVGVADGNGASGGGHGGRGGCGAVNIILPGAANDSAAAPETPGSGGGSGGASLGGAGGGVLRLEVGDTVVLNGSLFADGCGNGNYGGAGAGGSIWVACSNFTGSNGVITAVGGSSSYGGGGGGGRIALVYTNWLPQTTVRISANYGSIYYPQLSMRPMLGTVWLRDTNGLSMLANEFCGYCHLGGLSNWALPSAALENIRLGVPDGTTMAAANGLILGTNAQVYVGEMDTVSSNYPRLVCGGNLVLTNSGYLVTATGVTNAPLLTVTGAVKIASSCWIYACSNPTNGGYALFKFGELEVAAGSGINADYLGYRGRSGPKPGTNAGNGGGGGGHGGQGGRGSDTGASGGGTNDSDNAPVWPGSGGGSGYSSGAAAGEGGGLLLVDVGNTAAIYGSLSANGRTGPGWSGGGAGGAILLSCYRLAGGGGTNMTARGGDGGTGYGGGGGGGRIAVWEGVSERMRNRYLDGEENLRAVARSTNCPAAFAGLISVTNGAGNYAPLATPGTVFFFKYVKGTVFLAGN